MKAMERPTKSFLESLLLNDPKKANAATSVPLATVQAAVQATVQATVQRVHCPTCGSSAERHHTHDGLMRTQCSRCDYLMTICANTGRVIEAYAPSFSPATLSASLVMG